MLKSSTLRYKMMFRNIILLLIIKVQQRLQHYPMFCARENLDSVTLIGHRSKYSQKCSITMSQNVSCRLTNSNLQIPITVTPTALLIH